MERWAEYTVPYRLNVLGHSFAQKIALSKSLFCTLGQLLLRADTSDYN